MRIHYALAAAVLAGAAWGSFGTEGISPPTALAPPGQGAIGPQFDCQVFVRKKTEATDIPTMLPSSALPGVSSNVSQSETQLASNELVPLVANVVPTAPDPAASKTIDYMKDVRPILSAHCYRCHGPDKLKGGLRLDDKASALRGGDDGVVLKAGDSAGSILISLVSSTDPNNRMPAKGKPLTPDEVAVLKAWVDQGLQWPDDAPRAKPTYWAFKPVKRPAVPEVQDKNWVRNPIDNFVLAELEAKGVKPSPEADKITLLRRLHFDITGLPPTPAEVDAFVKDPDPHAYERAVNRLLASPHYGERWGRYWLDLARYADSDGYEKDTDRPYAYRYRDWVIHALNRDLPYDQFVIDQIAGDLLPNPTENQLIATGFSRNTLTNREGGIDPEEDRVKQAVDRTNTVGTVFLGLTVGCAQCHSHKYDPISQREYYEMYSFWNHAEEKDVPAPLPGEEQAYKEAKARFDKQKAELEKAIADYRPELAKTEPQWEASLKLPDAGWTVLDPASYLSAGGATLKKLDDESLLASGASPGADTYTVVARTTKVGIQAIRLEALTDPSLTDNGPGRAHNGNFVLAEFTVTAAPFNDPHQTEKVKIKSATATFQQGGYEITNVFDGNPNTGWAIYRDHDMNHSRTATFILDKPVGFPEGTILTFTLDHRYGRAHNIGRFRLSATTADPGALTYPDDVYQALKTPADQRTDEQKNAVLDYYGRNDPKMRELQARLDGLMKAEPEPPKTMAQAMAENPEPPQTYIHVRGDFMNKGDKVPSATLAVLNPFHPRKKYPDRLDLAHWIVDPANPLTARVQVNRIWEHLFGKGIVTTPDDFGTRGDKPTHPKLLDWLASQYMANGWSTKDLIRLIVNSATYRQSSKVRTDIYDDDPLNAWLARQNRYRVEAEITRDMYLAASGLLNPEVGGPSVRPPLPPGVADLGYAGSIKWPESTGADKYRRGIYIFFQRTVPYPMLMTFDCPDSNESKAKRSRSNTPLQALTLLNSPVFFECAQALGHRVLAEAPPNDPARIRYAFRLCLSRSPSDAELTTLEQFLKAQEAKFRQDTDAAVQFASLEKQPKEDVAEKAAYVALARVIMNLDEFLTRE